MYLGKPLVSYSSSDSDYNVPPLQPPETKQFKQIRGDENSETVRKRRKRRHVDPSTWSANSNKLKKERGEEYYGKKKVSAKWTYKMLKPARKLKERCHCRHSENNQKAAFLKCSAFSEEDRRYIFSDFWKLSKCEKKVYIKMLVTVDDTKRHRGRKNNEKSRREYSYVYNLTTGDKKLQVCKKMFLNTLGIGK